MVKSVAFFAYPVGDMAKARAFYEGVLGLGLTSNFEDCWIEYDAEGGTLAITTMAETLTPGAPGGWVALEVDDLDTEVARMKSEGVPVVRDIFESPVCRMAVITDPDGNGIMLHQCKPGHP